MLDVIKDLQANQGEMAIKQSLISTSLVKLEIALITFNHPLQ